MTFLIHYILKTGVKDLHFDIVSNSPVSRDNLDSLRVTLAQDATTKTRGGVEITPDRIVIANIIPMPDSESRQQIGGS